MLLQRYNILITYMPGRDLVVPDCISRAFGPPKPENEKRGEGPAGATATISRHVRQIRSRVATSQVTQALRIHSLAPHSIPTHADPVGRHHPTPALAARISESVVTVPTTASNATIAGVFLLTTADGLHLLVEQQGGTLALPSTRVSNEARFRSQLDARLYNTYDQSSGAQLRGALSTAVSYKRRVPFYGCTTHFFACIIPSFPDKPKVDEHSSATLAVAFVKLNGELPFAFADKNTFQFLHRLHQEYRGIRQQSHRWTDAQFKHLLHVDPVPSLTARLSRGRAGDVSSCMSHCRRELSGCA